MSEEQGTRNREHGAARPGSWIPVPGSWPVIGQERAVGALRRAVEDEARLAHAYLFAGPEHVGKATAARRFAQALNCTADADRPCGECRACRLIAEDKHPDVEWVTVGGVCEEPEHRDHSADSS